MFSLSRPPVSPRVQRPLSSPRVTKDVTPKKQRILSLAEKQVLIESFQYDVADRIAKLKADHQKAALALKEKVKRRINRVFKEHRSKTVRELRAEVDEAKKRAEHIDQLMAQSRARLQHSPDKSLPTSPLRQTAMALSGLATSPIRSPGKTVSRTIELNKDLFSPLPFRTASSSSRPPSPIRSTTSLSNFRPKAATSIASLPSISSTSNKVVATAFKSEVSSQQDEIKSEPSTVGRLRPTSARSKRPDSQTSAPSRPGSANGSRPPSSRLKKSPSNSSLSSVSSVVSTASKSKRTVVSKDTASSAARRTARTTRKAKDPEPSVRPMRNLRSRGA